MNIANAIRRMRRLFRRDRPGEPPTILFEGKQVTEWARQQAMVNMKADSAILDRVKAIVIRECGGNIARGEIEFRRRFPELFEDDWTPDKL